MKHASAIALALGLALAAGPAQAVQPLGDIPLATNVYTAAEVDAIVPSLLGSPFVHLGSTVVEDSAWTASFVGGGSYASGTLTVMPDSSTKSTGVFAATITSANYIVDLGGQAVVTSYNVSQTPAEAPTRYSVVRVDGHTMRITATNVTPSFAATSVYRMRIDDFAVYTYDRPAYEPNTTTNDAAALPSFVDTVSIATAPDRIVANAKSVRDYVCSRKAEFAKAAWGYAPSGQVGQEGAVTIDRPIILRGDYTWLAAGNAVAISADGAGWANSATGSYYQVGLAGRADLRLTASDQQLQITDLQWATGASGATVSLDVPVSQLADPSTPPTIRYVDSLSGTLDWIDCSEQVSQRVSSVWRCTVSAELADARFFTAWASQGADTAYIRAPLVLEAGQIRIGNDTYSPQTVTIGGATYKILASPQ